MTVKVRFRLDFAPGASVGPGKIELLSAIETEGSLSAAARRVGMSYRRAWLLLDNLNHAFRTPVTTASVGGKGGGGVTLTRFGVELVQRYSAFDAEISRLADERWGRFSSAGRKGPARTAARRAVTNPRARRSAPKRP